jgi:hypothetical protein
MFKLYVNHAAQHLAEVEAFARNHAVPNILHLMKCALRRSVNITGLVENATRILWSAKPQSRKGGDAINLCGFAALRE